MSYVGFRVADVDCMSGSFPFGVTLWQMFPLNSPTVTYGVAVGLNHLREICKMDTGSGAVLDLFRGGELSTKDGVLVVVGFQSLRVISGAYVQLTVTAKRKGFAGGVQPWLVDYRLGQDNMPRKLNFGGGLTGEIVTISRPDLFSDRVRVLTSSEIRILPMGRIYVNSLNRLQLRTEWELYQRMVGLGLYSPYSNTGVTGSGGGSNV